MVIYQINILLSYNSEVPILVHLLIQGYNIPTPTRSISTFEAWFVQIPPPPPPLHAEVPNERFNHPFFVVNASGMLVHLPEAL